MCLKNVSAKTGEGHFEGLFHTIINPNRTNSLFGFDSAGDKTKIVRDVDSLISESENTRICSLSSSLSDVRMWSHYAGGHTGVAIAIDFSNTMMQVGKVTYAASLPLLNYGLLESPDAKEALLRKTDHWAYEDEYRIITKDEYFSINGKIKSIYVGPRVEKTRKALLEKIVRGKFPIRETKNNEEKIIVEEITPDPMQKILLQALGLESDQDA
ncbi:MAG: DUF2971 domain-containing protein [Burkholderiales bacterium]